MNNYEQEESYKVHLSKAKKAINFILVLFFITLLPVLFSDKIEQIFNIQFASFVALFISARYIFKYPIFAVITLGIMILFYFHGWFNFIFKSNFGPETVGFLFYFILILRILTTFIIIRGFYAAIKGMIGKEQLEKKHHTLDEDELNK